MRAWIKKISPIAFALAAVSSTALADLAERRFIQTLHPEIEELPLPQTALGFGSNIAVQGDVALVGAGSDTGHIAVFTRENRFWRRTGSLPCPQPICGPISLQDNVAVVHAYDLFSGVQTLSIFRHEQGTWTAADSIPKPLPDLPDLWVRTANYHHGLLATTVGPTFSNDSVEVYVYKLDAHAKVRRTFKLAPSDPDPGHNFGSDIAVGEGVIAVSDSFWSPGASGPRTGAVYIFERRGAAWRQTQILTAADGKANDEFGRRIVMQGNLLLVGAPNATRSVSKGSAQPTGAIYAFERAKGTWRQRAKFSPSTERFGPYTEFGSRIAISGEHAVIAATPLPDAGPERGLAFEYLLAHDRFVPVSYVRVFNPAMLALDGETMLVGSAWDNPESAVGHVAVYDLNAPLRRKPFCETARAGAFCDDFESATADNWQPYTGTWAVHNREYVGRAGMDQCGTGFSSNESLIRNLNAADVDVRLEMRAIQRVDKGIILRSTAAGDQIELNFRAGPFFSDLVVQELVGCQFSFLQSAQVRHEMGEVLRVRARLVGQRLIVWVNGRVVIHSSLPFRAKRGGVGLAVITDHGISAFDNVRVKVLK
jgi:hypothetical protein